MVGEIRESNEVQLSRNYLKLNAMVGENPEIQLFQMFKNRSKLFITVGEIVEETKIKCLKFILN